MKFTAITLFPSIIENYCGEGLLGQARERGIVRVECVNPREFASDVHRTVDDRAFGGGDGMVMKPESLAAAVESLGPDVRVAVLSPQGRVWNQSKAREWAGRGGHVALVCGRYAGIDQRFVEKYADEEISVGDFVLNGGELAALAVVESVTRLLPGALGNVISGVHDSFSDGLLEAPQFTRPREWEGMPVPSPLLSGNHAMIENFQRVLSVFRTALKRPELLLGLSDAELASLGLNREALLSVSKRENQKN